MPRPEYRHPLTRPISRAAGRSRAGGPSGNGDSQWTQSTDFLNRQTPPTTSGRTVKDTNEESHVQRVIWSSKNSGHPKHSTGGGGYSHHSQSQSNHTAGVPGALSPSQRSKHPLPVRRFEGWVPTCKRQLRLTGPDGSGDRGWDPRCCSRLCILTKGFRWPASPTTTSSRLQKTASPVQRSSCPGRGCTARCCCPPAGAALRPRPTGSERRRTQTPACSRIGSGDCRTAGRTGSERSTWLLAPLRPQGPDPLPWKEPRGPHPEGRGPGETSCRPMAPLGVP